MKVTFDSNGQLKFDWAQFLGCAAIAWFVGACTGSTTEAFSLMHIGFGLAGGGWLYCWLRGEELKRQLRDRCSELQALHDESLERICLESERRL